MKKLLFAGILAAGITAFAADQTVTGVITDSMCKTNHGMMQKGPTKMSDQDCTVACVKMMGPSVDTRIRPYVDMTGFQVSAEARNSSCQPAIRSTRSTIRALPVWRRALAVR